MSPIFFFWGGGWKGGVCSQSAIVLLKIKSRKNYSQKEVELKWFKAILCLCFALVFYWETMPLVLNKEREEGGDSKYWVSFSKEERNITFVIHYRKHFLSLLIWVQLQDQWNYLESSTLERTPMKGKRGITSNLLRMTFFKKRYELSK